MKLNAQLTRRERDITELLAWGASKKEVANHLFISERTVENHTRNIYEKTGCSKVNELSAWWFCFRFRIPLSLSPLGRKIVAVVVLATYIFGATNDLAYHQRVRVSSPRIAYRSMRFTRKNNNDSKTFVA
ncbi:helix-turn-helix transcriptional regulator [Proteiniphilum sp.]|uniref:helix-turn-helix transcriptional regulator n=1 Tax=Proteiniphilum sp. TaxID=1926877 RepID=UPI00331CBDB5